MTVEQFFLLLKCIGAAYALYVILMLIQTKDDSR